ncbi:MAG: hypothetical protein ACI8UO_000852 [Verrucomicrobiales bacterium]|jgi:hypothetical protein
MIDTIRLTCDLPLRKGAYDEFRKNQRSDWTFTARGIHHSHDDSEHTKLFGKHAHNDLRVGIGALGNLVWVEVSLPRLMGSANGILLKSQADLSSAIYKLLPQLQMFTGLTLLQPEQFILSRVDLVLNLPISPKRLLPIHKNARHPKIRRETIWYYNQEYDKRPHKPPCIEVSLNSVVFNGTMTRISLYNKMAEVYGGKRKADATPEATSTRIEANLTGKKHIAKLFGFKNQGKLLLNQLRFDVCYRVFRDLMLEFSDLGRMPIGKPKLETIIALLATHPTPHPALGGVEVLDWYGLFHEKKTFNAMRCKVAKLVPALVDFYWAEHLPADRLPDVVDIDADGGESRWSFNQQNCHAASAA